MTLRSEYKISLLGTKSRAWSLHQVFENEEQSWTSDRSHILIWEVSISSWVKMRYESFIFPLVVRIEVAQLICTVRAD